VGKVSGAWNKQNVKAVSAQQERQAPSDTGKQITCVPDGEEDTCVAQGSLAMSADSCAFSARLRHAQRPTRPFMCEEKESSTCPSTFSTTPDHSHRP
jgi:hypothetical protein